VANASARIPGVSYDSTMLKKILGNGLIEDRFDDQP